MRRKLRIWGPSPMRVSFNGKFPKVYFFRPGSGERRGDVMAFWEIFVVGVLGSSDFFLFYLHVLCICATLWVMTDLRSHIYVHVPALLEGPYSVTISALSRHNLFLVFRSPLLSPSLFLFKNVSIMVQSRALASTTPTAIPHCPLPWFFSPFLPWPTVGSPALYRDDYHHLGLKCFVPGATKAEGKREARKREGEKMCVLSFASAAQVWVGIWRSPHGAPWPFYLRYNIMNLSLSKVM